MEEPKSPSTEIYPNDCLKKSVHFWANIDTDDITGKICKFDITVLDPKDGLRKTMIYDEFKRFDHSDPLYEKYDWEGLEHMIENAGSNAVENGIIRMNEAKKKTYNTVIYRTAHYYK
jgi:hypothetical protein